MKVQNQERCVVSLLRERARTMPDKPYFTCAGETITFGDLWRRAGLAALTMQERGIEAGELIAGLSYNSVDYLILQHACLRLGAVFAPLNPSLQQDDVAQTLARIRPKLIVLSAEMNSKIAVGTELPKIELEALVAERKADTDPPEHRWKAADWSWVIFSGATTGLPKGIMLPHNFYMAHADRCVRLLRMNGDDKFYSSLQMCHAWLSFVVLGGCLVVGAHCKATRWFSASKWLDEIIEFEATLVDPFLPMASALVGQPPSPKDKTHKVRASPGPWGTINEWEQRMAFERRFGIQTINCFGITEAGGMVAAEAVDVPRKEKSSGQPTGDFEIVIADEQGNILPPGESGEVLYRPNFPAVMSMGYLGDAERTLATWRDLWIHSADLGYMDEEGYIFFLGRMPHWLRRKGENISARDVETSIRNVPGVNDAAVLAVPSPMGDDEIKAVVVLASGVTMSPAEIHAALVKRMTFFKVPRYLQIVDSFPRTIKGEPDRKLLQAQYGLGGSEWDADAAKTAKAAA